MSHMSGILKEDSQNVSMVEIVNSFNFSSMYKTVVGTRCRPWDDRELDMFEGMKFISFCLYSCAQTGNMLLLT